MMKKFIAFTLAEVLLVAGIAAFVGAMTIPNLTKSYTKKANVAKAKAVLTKLDAAVQQIDIDKILIGKTEHKDMSYKFLSELDNILTFRIFCGVQSSSNNCFSKTKFNNPSGYTGSDFSSTVISKGDKCSTAILNDGSEIALCYIYKVAYNSNAVPTDYRGFFIIDVDGANKGPQMRGEDIFVYGISGSGVAVFPDTPESNVFSAR